MKNVSEFIKFALSHANSATRPIGAKIDFPVGNDGIWKYLWGTRGQIVTQALLDARFKSYYSKNGWSRSEYDSITKNWVADNVHVTDCQGLLDAYLCNDTNANGNYRNYCTDKGLIAAINRPFVVGEAVFNGSDEKKTHVGWVCGFLGSDPLVVESRGLKYGVVITRMSKRSWKYRGLMTKKFSYESEPEQPQPTPTVKIKVKGSVRVREGNGVLSKKIKTVKNCLLPYCGQAIESPYWYMTEVDGKEGYISSKPRLTELVEVYDGTK